MELRHLRYFVAVAEAGNVSQAADQVRISQPALSRQIHDLEIEMGVALFERAGRALQLTGAGEDLLAHGRKVLKEAEAFRERARVLHRGDSGVLHVGATPQSLQRLFPAVLSRFRQTLPGVDVRLTEGNTITLVDLIQKGALHLALTAYYPELRAGSRIVGVVPLLAVCSGKTSVRRDTIEVRALEDIQILILQRGYGSRDLFDAACRTAHIRPNVFLESNAPGTLLSLAKAGFGTAILPATVSMQANGLTIQKLVQDSTPLEIQAALHWNPQRFLPPYAERFAEELSAQAAKEYADVAASWAARPGARSRRRKR
jgi:DNA-binding transcriptional LysR family regulator